MVPTLVGFSDQQKLMLETSSVLGALPSSKERHQTSFRKNKGDTRDRDFSKGAETARTCSILKYDHVFASLAPHTCPHPIPGFRLSWMSPYLHISHGARCTCSQMETEIHLYRHSGCCWSSWHFQGTWDRKLQRTQDPFINLLIHSRNVSFFYFS